MLVALFQFDLWLYRKNNQNNKANKGQKGKTFSF
jgi:hypothetical protein